MDKRFAIFDMDGTLVDSMGYWRRVGEEYLLSKGVEDQPADLWETLQSMTMPQSAAWLIRRFDLAVPQEQAEAEMDAVMVDHYLHDIPLKPGVMDCLTGLRARGTKMCVASNTPAPLVRACLERLGVLDLFDFCVSGEEVGVGKDRPDIFLAAAARLGSAPEDTAVYEDALFAVRSAKSAGFYVVGVYDEVGADEWDQLCALADETVTEWGEAAP